MKSLYPPGHIAPGFTLGRHLTVEYYGCASHSFLSLESVQQKMEDAARAARAHIVSSLFHPFEPQGISGVVVITESHLALHAWPEYDYAAVDIFTCSNSMDVSAAVDYLAQAFGAARVEISSVVDRGVFPLNKESIPKGGADRFDLECPGPNSHGQDPQNSRERHGESGVSLWVDLFQCGRPFTRDNLDHFLNRAWDFPGMIDGRGHGTPSIQFWENGFMARREKASILGRIYPGTARMALDVFAGGELPIRRFSEFAQGFFGADHYKLDLRFRG